MPITGFQVGDECPDDLAVGNFDRMQHSNPPQREPNLQLAVASAPCNATAHVQIFDVNPLADPTQGFQVTGNNVYSFSDILGGVGRMALAAADLQGRSSRLGAPTKVTINNTTQPSTVIAMPPMHADFITAAGAKAPEVLNLSVVPEGFRTGYKHEGRSGSTSTAHSRRSVNCRWPVTRGPATRG